MPFLHIVCSDGRTYDHPLEKDKTTIGRSKDNDIVLTDNTASRSHVRITRTAEGFALLDLGSFNGTNLNGTSIQSAQLHHEDLIEIGLTKLTFLTERTDKTSPTDSIIITPDAEYDTGQRNNSHFGGAAANINDHIARGFFNR